MPLVHRSAARTLGCAAAMLLAVSLAGCFSSFAEPDRTDTGASAEPAEPIAMAAGPEAACGEAVFWGGPPEGALPPDADYGPGFAMTEAIEGFDVLCASSWTYPQNDCQMQFARAYIDGGADGARLNEIDEALTAWSVEHGLQQTRIGKSDNTRSYGIEVDPDPEMGAAVMTQLTWAAVSRYNGADEVQQHADHAGIALDGGDVLVTWQVCPALQGWETPPAP